MPNHPSNNVKIEANESYIGHGVSSLFSQLMSLWSRLRRLQ